MLSKVLLGLVPVLVFAQQATPVFLGYDSSIRPMQFAAAEIRASLESKRVSVLEMSTAEALRSAAPKRSCY